MNKGELVEAIANASNLSKADAESALNAFIGSVQSALAVDDKVTLPGFGTFAPSARKARTGMNPQTREPIQIAASKSVKFTVGSELKRRAAVEGTPMEQALERRRCQSGRTDEQLSIESRTAGVGKVSSQPASKPATRRCLPRTS